VRCLSFVDPRNGRPRSDAKLIGIKEKCWIETDISSWAEAAGAQISMAAMKSVARYSSRFKAPPRLFSIPSQERCLHLSRSRG
jgi:hypothetical protein